MESGACASFLIHSTHKITYISFPFVLRFVPCAFMSNFLGKIRGISKLMLKFMVKILGIFGFEIFSALFGLVMYHDTC